MDFVGPEAEGLLTWEGLLGAFAEGHARGKPEIADLLLYRGADTMLDRAAWITGLGALVKVATVMPGNAARGLGTVQGVVTLFDDETGVLSGIVDFHLVTKWKTAGDSLYAASRLARKDSRRFLLVGAGTVARSMIGAYRSLWPEAEFEVWNRTPAGAEAMAAECGIGVARDLEAAVGAADVICTATMAKSPVIKGEWLRPGQHLDLIGAYNPSMREVDDTAMRRARVFVDARATTVHHIGELIDPIASGAISEADIVADFYEGDYRRLGDEITIAKNGGGAHLDLMTARYILDQWQAR
ncbi:ornithine cyclodeaminase family protein [Stagnihabitans tardus]|uniref:Ornithine cyclodeaminase n=1 Tax=Stagnihabitans tardus TaxID=2699202 RepID=A0AAE5BV31_9RHOB|nr:ornithine cyclodeaminase [Stagnihabitans tardus]NBZ87394.1 ornithine cyclodeaminase [Stagnihabitans tardus]